MKKYSLNPQGDSEDLPGSYVSPLLPNDAKTILQSQEAKFC